MTVKDLCENIGMPSEITERVLLCPADRCKVELLADLSTAQSAYKQLKAHDDSTGIFVLAHFLQAALLTYARYKVIGIDERIFFDTMACLSRFVREHRLSYGEYGFDRGWWAYRQLSMVLFRIGELEYEYHDSDKTVYIHIPTGADIALSQCRSSYDKFISFSQKYFKTKHNYKTALDSWLLSPALDDILPSDSKIRRFKDCFDIVSRNEEETEFLLWVYGRMDSEYQKLPEKTTLQRNMKRYLLDGGKVGSAYGVLKRF